MKATPLLLGLVILLLVVNLLASFGIVGGKSSSGQYAVYSSAEWGLHLVNQIAKKRGLKEGAELTFNSPAEARLEGYPLILDALAEEGWEYVDTTVDGLVIVCGPKGSAVPFRNAASTAVAPAAPVPAPAAAPAPAAPQQ